MRGEAVWRRGREKKGDGNGARGKRKKEIELEVGGDECEFFLLCSSGERTISV
jgi:hypothetical protein